MRLVASGFQGRTCALVRPRSRSRLLGPLVFAIVIVGALLLSPIRAMAEVELKIATIAPQGSPWAEALRKLAAEWWTESEGEVRVRVYSDGIVGDEPDILRKMRLGQLHGAALTQLALAEIYPPILAISTPYLLRSIDEFRFLLSSLIPQYERSIREAGFVAISWAEAGWVHFFASERLASPHDLKRLDLAVPAGDDDMLQIWRRLGFKATSLDIGDYAMALQTGMVEAFYAPPAMVAAFGWYGPISHMNSLPVAPAIGAIVFTERAWRTVPEAYHERFIEMARAMGVDITAASATIEDDAIDAIRGAGVEIVSSSDAEEVQWWSLGSDGARLAVGRLFSEEEFETVVELLESHRVSSAREGAWQAGASEDGASQAGRDQTENAQQSEAP